MSEWILEAQSLHYHYPCGKVALNGLDLNVARGTRLAVLGANGAGKTTLFLSLNGLLRPKSGCLKVNGFPAGYRKRDLLEWRQRVGLVFQNPDDQVVGGNVLQDVAFGPLNLGLTSDAARQRACEALDVLALGRIRDMPTHELSFGMRKLVAIAGVLAMRPEVIVLDEPTAGIDPEGAQQVLEALAAVQRQGTALVISTHDMDLAWEWADEVAVLVEGRTARQGPVTDVFADTALLQQARLRQPWLPEITAHLQDALMLPPDICTPRNRAAFAATFAAAPPPGDQRSLPRIDTTVFSPTGISSPTDQQPLVVLLNGASSAGKTSIACALQQLSPRPFLHAQIDGFIRMLPSSCTGRCLAETPGRYANLFVQMFHDMIAGFVKAREQIIVDHVVGENPDWRDDLYTKLHPARVVTVGVHCSLPCLTTRERHRRDRQGYPEVATRQYNTIHQGITYDLEVDTTHTTSTACAKTILDFLRSPLIPVNVPPPLKH